MFKLKNFQSPSVFYSIIFLSISKTLLLNSISEVLRDAALVGQPEELSPRLKVIYGRTIRKVMGGEGNFRAARIFFRYQILCMNFI